MKKIKYLFGFLVVGLGLLFNQSFGIDVEVVSTQFDTGFTQENYSKSYSYLYRLNHQRNSLDYGIYQGGCFGNGLYFNKQLSYNHFCAFPVSSSYGYSNYYFNASIFDDEFFPGGLKCVYSNSCFTTNVEYSKYNGNPYLILGQNDNFGKNAFYMDCYGGGSGCSQSPKYFFGGPSYFQGYDWLNLTAQDINQSIRFFYNTTVGSNNISNINIINPNTQPATFGWEYFTNQQTRTNFGYIVDSQGWKGKHFGSMGMGYSFVYNKSSINSNQTISWDDLGFATVYDSTWSWVKSLGGIDLVNNGTDSTWFPGVLVLRKLQYSSQGDEGVIVISKNPNNTQQLLYQEFSCQTNNFECLAKGIINDDGVISNYCPSYIVGDVSTGTSSYNPCLVLGQGLLTYNGDVNILPFENSSQTVNISDYPILSYLFNTSSSMLGGTYTVGDSFCIGDDPTGNGICFGKVSTENSIKDNYLNCINPNISSSDILNNELANRCLSDSNFAFLNPILCNYYQNLFSTTTALGSGYYYQYSVDSGGNITMEIIDQAGLFENHTGYVWIQDENGNWVTNCDGGWCNPNPTNSSGSVYLSGDILSTGYYDISSSIFFGCPYPYDPIFSLGGWDLKLGRFDIVGPINCFISAFNHGKSFNFLDNVGLFNFGPLFSGNTQQHKILFRFFDILLAFGMLLLIRFIYKLFK